MALYSLFYVGAIILIFSAINYAVNQKRKLTDEEILLFEREMKPKVLMLIVLTIMPALLFSIYMMVFPAPVLSNSIFGFVYLLLVAITITAYYRSIKISSNINKTKSFGYISNYILLIGLAQCFLMAGLIMSF